MLKLVQGSQNLLSCSSNRGPGSWRVALSTLSPFRSQCSFPVCKARPNSYTSVYFRSQWRGKRQYLLICLQIFSCSNTYIDPSTSMPLKSQEATAQISTSQLPGSLQIRDFQMSIKHVLLYSVRTACSPVVH